MKRLMLLLLLSFQTINFINGSAEKPEGPITNLPNELLEKMALDIIMPQIINAKTLPELENVNKNALKGFALTSKQHFAIVKDPRFIKKVQAAYEKKRNEIIESINVNMEAMCKTLKIEKCPNIKNGIDVFLTYKMSPLMLASQGGFTNIVQTLIENGAKIDLKDREGYTALFFAISGNYPHHINNNKIKTTKLLIDKGANINIQAEEGTTPLLAAIINDEMQIVRLLLDNNANVNLPGNNGATALMAAAEKGHLSIVKLLINKGADVNAKAEKGETALMCAAKKGHIDIVKLLINKGADVNIQDKDGSTAYDIAKKKNHTEIINLLEQYKK